MRRKRMRVPSLVVWNLLVWLSGACVSQEIMTAQVSANPQSAEQAQIAKGREVVGEACVACHTNILRMMQVHKQSADQWKDTVYSMIGRGAQIMPDEIGPVIVFLIADSGRSGETSPRTSNAGRPAGREQPPEAEGRAILQRTCQQCHDLATASTKPPSEDWNAVVARMTGYGARLTPADQQKLVEYLNSLAR
jgi:cytochrome c5